MPLGYSLLKTVHISLAMVSISGLLARWWWVRTKSPFASHVLTRSLPHLIDTLFLASGIWLMTIIHQYPFTNSWLTAKILGLVAYIIAGSKALKHAKTDRGKAVALAIALLLFIWIATVARTKTWTGFFS